MPPIVRGIVWKQVYDHDAGLLNAFLLSFGILDKPINWLASFEYAIPAVIIAGIWGEIPKAGVFLLAGLQAIPPDLYEAARNVMIVLISMVLLMYLRIQLRERIAA